MNQARRQHRHDERVERHHVLADDRKQGNSKGEPQGCTETGSSRDTQGEGTGKGIVEDRLHLGASQRQRGSDHHCHQGYRQADLPHDHTHLSGRVIWYKQRLQHLCNAVIRWPQGQVEQQAHQQQHHETGKNQSLAQYQPTVAMTLSALRNANGFHQ
ncbi:hypothetical protein D3C80_1547250 [compost metagenome]